MASPTDWNHREDRVQIINSDGSNTEAEDGANIPENTVEENGNGNQGAEGTRNQAENRIRSYDFSQCSSSTLPASSKWRSINDADNMKHFRVRRKEGNQTEKVVRIYKDECSSTFDKLALKFGMNKKKMGLEYAILQKDGTESLITVNPSDGDEGLELFYLQAIEMSLVTVYQAKRYFKRKLRPCERTSKEMAGSAKNMIDKKFYQNLIGNPDVAEVYVKKKNFIQFVLGMPEGCNLLNPYNYICHVPFCLQILKLRSANNVSTVVDHWKIHTFPERGSYHESCEVILRRHNFLMKRSADIWKHIDVTSEELENSVDDSGAKLCLGSLVEGCFAALKGKKFKGRYLLIDIDVVDKIIQRDPEALSSVPNTRTILNWSSSAVDDEEEV